MSVDRKVFFEIFYFLTLYHPVVLHKLVRGGDYQLLQQDVWMGLLSWLMVR